jgi:hypothetical protein
MTRKCHRRLPFASSAIEALGLEAVEWDEHFELYRPAAHTRDGGR